MFYLMKAGGRAFFSLLIPGMSALLMATILTTLAVLAVFITLISWGSIHYSAYIQSSSLSALAGFGGSIGSFVVAWFLFPGILPVIVSFFDDKIAGLIDTHDYPSASHSTPASYFPEMLHDLGFGITAIGLNLLCLPLYLVPGINLIIFYLLNGYLLGREFFNVAAKRYMTHDEANILRRRNKSTVFTAGVLLALLATLPLVNLIAPFWGVALMTHLVHQLRPIK